MNVKERARDAARNAESAYKLTLRKVGANAESVAVSAISYAGISIETMRKIRRQVEAARLNFSSKSSLDSACAINPMTRTIVDIENTYMDINNQAFDATETVRLADGHIEEAIERAINGR